MGSLLLLLSPLSGSAGGSTPQYASGQIVFSGVPNGVNAAATGQITPVGQPANGNTLTINGAVFTFSTNRGPYDIEPSSDPATQAANILAALSASTDPLVSAATYSINADLTIVDIAYNNLGTGGNAFTLATNSAGLSLSGAHLTGGSSPDTLTVGSVTFRFWDDVSSEPDAPFIHIGGLSTANEVGANTVEKFVDQDPADLQCSYVNNSGTITLTALVTGAAGNSIPLSESASNCTVVPFSGGTD